MAAPSSLKRYGLAAFTGGTLTTVVAAVPANRALAISKITVCGNGNGAFTVDLYIGGVPIAVAIPLASNGQVYTETGLVALAGETVQARMNITNGGIVSVFGEEVDN